ncbi:MAG TPA: 2Fe-2S iron-sulfur cluster-binding protein [Candidatus Absconditabacterales bacterium]|nr:2Fe-2S iron-sulfur cluster-binding protein [Candidatus Absconditabacterales bacterium]
MAVKVTLEDEEGKKLINFQAQDYKSFVDMAEELDFEIPSSCRAGACFVCAARVKTGAECIDIGKMGVPLVDIEEDQILTCIGGIKSECLEDGKDHEVVLQKLF